MNVIVKLAAEARGTPWFVENAYVARDAPDASARFFRAGLAVVGQRVTSTINVRCDGSSADRRALADLRSAGYSAKFLRRDTWAQGWGDRAVHGVRERRRANTTVSRSLLTRLTRIAGSTPLAVTVSRRRDGTEFPGTGLLATCTAVDDVDRWVFHVMVQVYARRPALGGVRFRRVPLPKGSHFACFSLDAGSFVEARRLRARLDRVLFAAE